MHLLGELQLLWDGEENWLGSLQSDTADLNAPSHAIIVIGRRNIEGAGRTSYYEHQNYRAVAGLGGALGQAWTYDAYAQYYYTTLFNSNSNYLDYAKVNKALQVTGTAATPVCI